MKVFEYDISTGNRGAQIADIARPDQSGGWTDEPIRKPKPKAGENWIVCTRASRSGKPIKFDFPVCFCIGQVTEGTDTFWEWIILIPENMVAA